MKFIEWNSREVLVSTRGELWQRVLMWSFGILILFFFFREGIEGPWQVILGFSFSAVFLVLPELFLTIRFDVSENTISKNANLFTLKFFYVEAPIDTSRIIFKIQDAGGISVLSAFLELQSGKLIKLGSFFSKEKARMFIKKLIKYVPIQYKF